MSCWRFGSDSPITPLDPWAGIRAAVFHHAEDERLSPRSAFNAHTRGGHQARGDDVGGVLVPGAVASYAVWDLGGVPCLSAKGPVLPDVSPGNPLPTCVRTVVAGVPVYTAEDLS